MNSVLEGSDGCSRAGERERAVNFREKLDLKGLWVFAALRSSSLQALLGEALQAGESEPGQGPELIQRLSNLKLCTVYC